MNVAQKIVAGNGQTDEKLLGEIDTFVNDWLLAIENQGYELSGDKEDSNSAYLESPVCDMLLEYESDSEDYEEIS